MICVAECECLHLEPFPELSSIAPMERYALVLFGLQGGGLAIYGTATLTNTIVYENRAAVCSPVESSLSSHLAPRWNDACAHGWQFGAGVFIWLTAPLTKLTNTSVYKNRAGEVCSPVEPCLSSHPAPRWNVT